MHVLDLDVLILVAALLQKAKDTLKISNDIIRVLTYLALKLRPK